MTHVILNLLMDMFFSILLVSKFHLPVSDHFPALTPASQRFLKFYLWPPVRLCCLAVSCCPFKRLLVSFTSNSKMVVIY